MLLPRPAASLSPEMRKDQRGQANPRHREDEWAREGRRRAVGAGEAYEETVQKENVCCETFN